MSEEKALSDHNGPAANRLEYWAEQRPEQVAIIDDEGQLSWREWNQRADALAESLHRAGIGPNDVVAARMQNRKEWAILHAALGKLGCRLLGMNWRLTPLEAEYILANSGARALFCDDEEPALLTSALDKSGVPLRVSLAPAPGFLSFASLLALPAPARYSRADPPLIIYTSGTTGFPKGVEMNRNAADPRLKEYGEAVRGQPSGEHDVVLITMPMHHGAGPAIVRTGCSRGSLMIFMGRFDPEAVLARIQQHRVTVWSGVPTMFKRIAALPPDVIARYDLSSIRALSVGAAPATQELKLWIMATFGDCLKENYGSTETGMIASLEPAMQKLKPGSVGKPFRHVDISIRDDGGRELPAGEMGELWVRTPALIDRYLNEAPLGEDLLDREGFFRVGDVGWIDGEGYLYITDRSKDMIISGGVNIYPAEIEAVLLQHPAVQDAAAIGIPHDEFGEQVKAFCELKPRAQLSADELLAFASERLASYKRPRSIDFVEELPRNTMGKILKRILREPYWRDHQRPL